MGGRPAFNGYCNDHCPTPPLLTCGAMKMRWVGIALDTTPKVKPLHATGPPRMESFKSRTVCADTAKCR
jgi:hypothetical protein